jgi:hypothetical protein
VLPVSDKDARFRRLRKDGDLFAHFGIELEPAEVAAPTRSEAAIACTRCRWYVWRSQTSCPVCGQPAPVCAVDPR